MLTLTVGKNGEDYYTIQEAINAVPYEEKARIIISEARRRYSPTSLISVWRARGRS